MVLAALGVVAAFFLASPTSAAPATATPHTSLRAQVASTSLCRVATPRAVATCRATDSSRDEPVVVRLLGRHLRLRCVASMATTPAGHRIAGGVTRARRDRRPEPVACALTRLASAR